MGRNTLQKEIIHRTLCMMHNHPTAAMVYDRVHQSHPTISRSTVFRVLAQMAEEGTIRRLGLSGSDTRYDGDLHPHGHARCRICGAVADIPWAPMEPPADTGGYLLEECAVEYRGLCPACRRAAEQNSSAERRLSIGDNGPRPVRWNNSKNF